MPLHRALGPRRAGPGHPAPPRAIWHPQEHGVMSPFCFGPAGPLLFSAGEHDVLDPSSQDPSAFPGPHSPSTARDTEHRHSPLPGLVPTSLWAAGAPPPPHWFSREPQFPEQRFPGHPPPRAGHRSGELSWGHTPSDQRTITPGGKVGGSFCLLWTVPLRRDPTPGACCGRSPP